MAFARFIPAAELKVRYSVFGHFYEVDLPNGDALRCRSALEIIPRSEHSTLGQYRSSLPDAVFVMMNPGSSSPMELGIPKWSSGSSSATRKHFVLTKPDTTQYQVMRAMWRMNWRHVRVINLSDLCEPKSGQFIQTYKWLEQALKHQRHSIFAKEREKELQLELSRPPGAPLVCGWGVSAGLDALIQLALPSLDRSGRRAGLLRAGSTDKYFHPLPTLQTQKDAWVSDICKLLKRGV